MADFTAMTGAVEATSIVNALIAIGAILVLPKVAAWGVREVRGIIDDTDDWDGSLPEGHDGYADEEFIDDNPMYDCSCCGEMTNGYDAVCEHCGHDHDDEGA